MMALRAVPLLLVLLLLPASASARAPEDFGSYAVRTERVRVPLPLDPRGPEGLLPWVDVDLYVPVGRGPFPLVHLGHAWPGTLREFPLSGWGRRLASRGFVTLVADRRAGSTLTVTPEIGQATDAIDLSSDVNSEDVLRVLRWAIDESGLPVDPARIAIGGHSLGAYYATFAAVKAKTQGPDIDTLLLLDPSDERLGDNTLQSSLAQTRLLELPTLVLASEMNQHPVQCNMADGPDCTLVAPQQYAALGATTPKLGLKVVGSVHEDVEDPSTIGTPESVEHLRTYQRYAMAWTAFWLARDCSAAPYLGGSKALQAQREGTIAIYPGATPLPACR